MAIPIVVLDACVLYPAALRDLIMRLAAHRLIQAKWTEEIHEEWIAAVLRERADLTRERLQRTRELMDAHAGDCLVTGYERHKDELALPDEKDRHVLAAAIECEADAIVTWNVKDFPKSVIESHGIELWTPDELLADLLATHQDLVIEVMREHRASLKNPPKSEEEYLDTLVQQRLIRAIQIIRDGGGKV
jgi:predicted nucleic acid-binding protein